MKKWILIVFIVLVVIILSNFLTGCCNLFALGAVKLESLPTAPGVEGKSILYSDDFSKPDSNWDTGSWNNGGADYYNGGYRINVPSENNIFAYLHQSFQKDVSVEVDVTDISKESFGSKGDFFAGITVRHTSDDSKYEFTISVNQNYGSGSISIIHQNISNPIGTTIKNWKLPPNWDGTFHIRADAIGDQLSLYVNGYLVYSVKDSEISSGGDIGFFGGRAGAKQYLFDNLVVYAVDEKTATTEKATTTNVEETADWGED